MPDLCRKRQGMKRKARAEQMAQLIEAQAKSGLSKQAFCTRHDIPLARFYYWQRRLCEVESTPAFSPGFTALSVCPAAELELRLPTGQWIGVRVQSADALGLLLKAMEQDHA